MSTRSVMRTARTWSGRTARSIRTALMLRACDVVGRDVRLRGRPALENHGRMEIGSDVVLQSRPIPVQLGAGPDGSLLIRDRVHVGCGTSLHATGLIVVGEGTRIGALGLFADADRGEPGGWRPTSRPIVVGRHVVIGSNVTVLPGSFIGDGAMIGAGAVVSGIVPPRAFAAGVPARAEAGRPSAHGADPVTRVLNVVSKVLGLPGGASLSLQMEQMSGWDAAGALRLALALEEEFDTPVPDHEFLRVQSLGDLVDLVRHTMAPAPDRSTPLPEIH